MRPTYDEEAQLLGEQGQKVPQAKRSSIRM